MVGVRSGSIRGRSSSIRSKRWIDQVICALAGCTCSSNLKHDRLIHRRHFTEGISQKALVFCKGVRGEVKGSLVERNRVSISKRPARSVCKSTEERGRI